MPVPELHSARSTGMTGKLWTRVAGLRQAITELAFLQQLEDGTLEREAFRYYLAQDLSYLNSYARALALVSVSAPDTDSALFWAGSAHSCIAAEMELHREILKGAPENVASPVTLGYSSYVVATASTAPYPVAASALLPCFWLYAEVGWELHQRLLTAHALADHPYRAWIDTYAQPAFIADAARAADMVNKAASTASEPVKEAMEEAFLQATRYEFLFWEQGLSPQSWPDAS